MTAENRLPKAYHVPAEERQATRVTSPPKCVFIEVTNRCNMVCATCPRTFFTYEQPKDLGIDEFVDLIDRFPKVERAVLHGIGEPLINRHLPDMIRILKDRDVAVLFNSNATLLDASWQEALTSSGLDEYRVSLNCADPVTYQRVHGRDLFSQVVDNLRGLVATKERLGASTPRVSLWCIGMKENMPQVPDLIRLAADVGIPEVYLQRLTYYLAPEKRQGLARPDVVLFGNMSRRDADILDECEQISQELDITFRASGATDPRHSLEAVRDLEERPWTRCARPWTTAYITANGNALPCCISPFATTDYQSLVMGNIWAESWDQIWNNARYRAWREALLGPSPNEACLGCGSYWSL